MTEECRKVQLIIDSWEREGSVSPEDMKVLEEHLASCPDCAARYGSLAAFIRRDGSVRAAFDTEDRADDVTDAVMAGVSGSRFRKPAGLYRSITAAAAVILVGVLAFRMVPQPSAAAPPENGSFLEVRFTLAAPQASSVTLVGDFTDWETSGHTLTDTDGDGVWETNLRLKKGRVYEYNFIIDGEVWIPDPNALMQVDDGFGGESSILSL